MLNELVPADLGRSTVADVGKPAAIGCSGR